MQRENLSGQYVNIKRKKYAAGLLWQPLVAGFTPRAYAYKLARGIDRRLNRYISYNGMIGLGARVNGQRSGMPSVAAEVIEALPGYASMLCAFQVDDKFVLVAVLTIFTKSRFILFLKYPQISSMTSCFAVAVKQLMGIDDSSCFSSSRSLIKSAR